MSNQPIKVFFSYSHRDEEFKDELVNHLSILQRQGVIDGWHDRLISPGSEWDREIDTYLNSADIILLMISADFLASNYCWGIEVKRALERHEAGEACVIPIVVRSVNWKNTPIAKLQALPKNAKPIRSWTDRDEAYTDVTEGIETAVNLLREQCKKNVESTLNVGIPTPKPLLQVELSPKVAADDFFNRGVEKQNKGDYQGAIADYNQAIKLNPTFAEAYCNRGTVRDALGDYQGAIADYNQAIKLNPDAATYFNQGNARSALGDYQGAIADYDQAIKLDPNDADAYGNRGNARSALGDYQGAIADYDQAIKLNPNYALVCNCRGNARYNLGNYQGAIADYDQAIKLNPSYALAYYNRGNARDDLGDYQGAIADYDQAIKLDPNYAPTYYNRALICRKQGNKRRAIADFQKAADLSRQQGNSELHQNSMNRLNEF